MTGQDTEEHHFSIHLVWIEHDSVERGSDYMRDGSQSHVYVTTKSPQHTSVGTRVNKFGMNTSGTPAPVGHRVQTQIWCGMAL